MVVVWIVADADGRDRDAEAKVVVNIFVEEVEVTAKDRMVVGLDAVEIVDIVVEATFDAVEEAETDIADVV